MRIVFIGLSITSSWGNGHATTYRSLLKALERRGHTVVFLEHDVPWYAANRDLPDPPFGHTFLYDSLEDLRERFTSEVQAADVVVVGSFVMQGIDVAKFVFENARGMSAFYDIDTPVTLSKLEHEDYEYLSPEIIPRFDLYLSFTGGPILRRLETQWGARRARPLYCSFDPEIYYPQAIDLQWDLGYMGTYSSDRQPMLERLLFEPARAGQGRFVVAGPQYPDNIDWPANVRHLYHLPPDCHRAFYNAQRYTLNITRQDMTRAGFAPSVRLFEAAGCGVPVISDPWDGLGTFFKAGREIVVAKTARDVLHCLWDVTEKRRREMGAAARERVLREHTNEHRATEFEQYMTEIAGAAA